MGEKMIEKILRSNLKWDFKVCGGDLHCGAGRRWGKRLGGGDPMENVWQKKGAEMVNH